MPRIAVNRWLMVGLCLFGGIAVGVSGFSSDSNHPTYLPPALHYLDAQYLAKDWWLASARHYHFAFFAIAAMLATLGVLEVGLAILNILAVAGALYACFLIVAELTRRHKVAIFTVFVAAFLLSRSFYSIGDSYLFTPSLQPSSLAAAATLAALLQVLRRRWRTCGAWLAVAGLCHVNFLVVNIPAFALIHLLIAVQEPPARPRRLAIDLLALLGPSLLLLALFVPLLLGVGAESLPPSQAAAADWIFFRFAVPFHYYPPAYLNTLYPFFCWQLLGLLWTRHAIADPAQRRVAWAIQIALAAVIWSATALTTFVFIPAVSRLFLWRLAPFAMLFAMLMVILGTLRAAGEGRPAGRMDWIILAIGIALLPTLILPPTVVAGQIVSTHGVWPAAMVPGLLFVAVALRWAIPGSVSQSAWTTAPMLVALLAVAVATQPSDGRRSRYSLLVPSPTIAAERDLFAFIRRSTPRNAQFATPPDLDYFRLEAARATIVDLKAMPINPSSLIAWYRRLGEVSGIRHPRDFAAIVDGYARLDAARADRLRRLYRIGYIVTRTDRPLRAEQWTEVFHNRAYRVWMYRSIRPA